MKYYTISQRNISPRPRSKRLQASGQAASGATAMTVLAGSGTASHIHANKAVLDRLGADAEGYLTLSTLSENTDPNTGDTVWQETDEKVKAGQADVARALAPDSPTFGVIEQRGDQRYVRMDFLNRLLQAHNGQNNVSPNDLTTQITDIEALFSLWTRGSLTALGRGSNASAGSGLDSEMLWSLLQDNYDGVHHIDSRYINFPTVDLSAYATQTWVAQQGYLTQHQSLSHLLPLAGGTLTGTLYTQAVTPVADNAYSLGIGGRRWSDLRTVKATVSGDLGVGGKVNAWGNIVPMPTTANGTTTYPQLGTGSQRWSNVVAVNLNSSGTAQLTDIRGTTARLTGAVTADSFVKTGGTGSQFLKADGSTDSTTYLPLYGGYLTGDLYTHSLLPYADNLYNLGDGLHRWASLRAVTANVSEDLGVGGRLLAYGDIVPMPTTDEETNETTWPQLGRADNRWAQVVTSGVNSAGNIVPAATDQYQLGTDALRWSQVVTWRLNVADGAVLGLLQVNGSATMMSGLYVPTGQALRIGDAVLRYDSATGSLYVTKHDGTPAHFYATGGVSALGSNASAGSGTGGIDAAMLWSLLQDNYDGVHHIDSRYINFPTVDLSAYATQTWVAQQGYLTQHQSLAAYATQTWVTQQGYLTQHQSLAAYALKTELPTTMAWTAITGKPSTFTPSTHTHTKSQITDFAHTHTKSQITDFAHTHTKSQITDFPSTWAWGSITGKPTTLSGYGITDAYTKTQVDAAIRVVSDRLGQMFTLEGSGTQADPYVIKANFGLYTEQFLSALGSNASAGSGTGGIDAAMLWSILQDNYDGVHHIDSRYISFPTVAAFNTIEQLGNGRISFSGSGVETVTLDFAHTHTKSQITDFTHTHVKADISDFTHDHDSRYYISNGTITLGSNSITPLTQHQSLAAYATQTWVTQQGYLTQHQSLAAYALKTELPTTMAWTAITGKPSTFTPSTHTHTKSQITDFAHTHTKSQITDFPSTWAWGSITGKPTTLSGYGITDAYTKAQADARYLRKDVGGFIDGELSLQGRNFGFVDGLFFNWLPAAEEITFDDYPALSDYLTYDAESKDSATVMEGTGQLFIANDVVLRDLCDGSYRNLTTGGITAYGHIAPPVSNSYNCGTPSCAWGNVFTAYLRSRPNTKLYIGAAGSVHIGITTGGNVTIGNSTTDLGYKLGVNGTFRAAGNASLGGTLTVARATTLSNTLAVTGATTLRSTLNVTGTTQLNNTLTLNNRLEMINLVTSDDESDPRVQICVDGDGLNIFDNTEGQDLLHVLYVVGQSYFTGKVEIENQLEVDGLISSYTGIYSRGYVSALGQNTSSDSRLKNILDCEAMPPIEAIAAAPAIHYTWKNRPGMGRQAGSTAQYWQKVVPECVSQGTDGMLSMQYGVIALLSAISLAQTAQDHERRLQRLETLKPSNPLNS